MKPFVAVLIAAASACVAKGQTAAMQPKFEVASVKRSEQCFGRNSIDPGAVALRGVPLKAVLMEAYKVKMEQIEGPSWLETECFDISGKFPDGASRDQLPAMLQSLLAERFRLAARTEDRPRTGYALVVDKGGPKCKQDDPKTYFMGRNARPGLTFFGAFGHGGLKGVMTMARLASHLSRQGYGPVEDATGLTGDYDIDLTWTPDPAFAPRSVTVPAPSSSPSDIPAPEGPSLFTAVRDQLGLRLERRNVQVQFVVVDHIERTPTEN